jgi:hypothetical protein
MSQHSKRLRLSALVLIAISLLLPALATAQPQRVAVRPPAERTAAAPSLFAELRSLLSLLWAETGSGLDPNGAANPGASAAPNAPPTADTGSGLDSDGRR